MLDALKQVDALLIIVGQEVTLRSIIERRFDLGLKESNFAGTVSDEELPKYYNLCDILCSIN